MQVLILMIKEIKVAIWQSKMIEKKKNSDVMEESKVKSFKCCVMKTVPGMDNAT